MDKFMRTYRFEELFDGDPNTYYEWQRKTQTATDLEFRKVLDENWVGQLCNPIIEFAEDVIATGLYTRVMARSKELWTALENAIANPGTANAAVRKKRQETLTAWRDDEQVLSLVVRSLMTTKLQDQIVFDKIRKSGKLILKELEKVYQPLGQKAIIRMTEQLYAIAPTPGESVIEFLCRIRNLVDKLAAAGAPTSNVVLHEIVPKRLQDQPGMSALANRWIHHRDNTRDISTMIDECREEIRNNPTQSFVPPQLYVKDTQGRNRNYQRQGRWHRKFPKWENFNSRTHGYHRSGKYYNGQTRKREQKDSDNEYSDRRRGGKVSCRRCEDREGRRDTQDKYDDEEEMNEREVF